MLHKLHTNLFSVYFPANLSSRKWKTFWWVFLPSFLLEPTLDKAKSRSWLENKWKLPFFLRRSDQPTGGALWVTSTVGRESPSTIIHSFIYSFIYDHRHSRDVMVVSHISYLNYDSSTLKALIIYCPISALVLVSEVGHDFRKAPVNSSQVRGRGNSKLRIMAADVITEVPPFYQSRQKRRCWNEKVFFPLPSKDGTEWTETEVCKKCQERAWRWPSKCTCTQGRRKWGQKLTVGEWGGSWSAHVAEAASYHGR